MIFKGDIDSDNFLWVKLIVVGTHRQQTIHAIIDTGFTGELMLPKEIATNLGLKQAGVAPCQYADGTQRDVPLYTATIRWGSKQQQATVHVHEKPTYASIGGGLLHDYILHADFSKNQLIIKEPEN